MTSKSNESKPFCHINGNTVGFLLIHGFAEGPYVANKIAKICVENGFNAKTICLSGHNSHYTDMPNYSTDDWLKEIQEAIINFERDCKRIILVGLSFGGNLALKIAMGNSDVHGVVTIETPVKISKHKTIRYLAIPALYPFKKYVGRRKKDYKAEEAKEKGFYTHFPLKNVADILAFMDKQRDELSKVSISVLIIQSTDGEFIRRDSANYIFNKIASKQKKILWIETHKHTNLGVSEINSIFKEVTNFFEI